ncbi:MULTISPECIES: hypothetical protein [Bacillus]|nr:MULTISPECIES: hypothetical protein [Bacillus cereus group]PGS97366.1 hypothetical protein COD09_20820 [Bacillus cereus]
MFKKYLCAFLSLTQISITVFGNTVMLSKTYQTIGELFPATYATDGYYTIIFGGVGLEKNIISLLLIILVTQLVAGITLVIKGMVKGRSSVVKEV